MGQSPLLCAIILYVLIHTPFVGLSQVPVKFTPFCGPQFVVVSGSFVAGLHLSCNLFLLRQACMLWLLALSMLVLQKGLIQFFLQFLFKWCLHVNFFIEKAGNSCLFVCNVLNEQTRQKNQEPFVCVSKFPFDYLISVSNKFRIVSKHLVVFLHFCHSLSGLKKYMVYG